MKSVGKQLEAARLAKNWTPELAARETKIKVDRLRDLEADNYSNFTSPAYARGFVRTYARSLGLDEYAILRQLDNKLPDDDTPNLVSDTNIGYLPETSLPPRVAHRDYTGLYILLTLGCAILLIAAFVLFEAYRIGELPRYFASTSSPEASTTDATTNTAAAKAPADSTARAMPVDGSAPPPAVAATDASTNAAPVAVRALPVDPSELAANTNAAPVAVPATPADAPVQAVRALPVDPSELTNAPTATPANAAALAATTPPRAQPVDLNDPALTGVPTPSATSTAPTTPVIVPSATARQSNSSTVVASANPASVGFSPSAVAPQPAATATAPATTNVAPQTDSGTGKPLVLTASQDSFVRVTLQDSPDGDKPLYASVLHSGQSIAFEGRKFSINVGVPSAVDIKLDGVNYGPHSDQETPETFTVESHQP